MPTIIVIKREMLLFTHLKCNGLLCLLPHCKLISIRGANRQTDGQIEVGIFYILNDVSESHRNVIYIITKLILLFSSGRNSFNLT